MTVIVNGVDITPYIAFGGFKWQRNDIESSNAGRTMDGTMQRGRIAQKARLDITCRLLRKSELNMIMQLVKPEYVTVQYDDPQDGLRICTMYSNNIPATFAIKKPDGTEWWSGVTFPLIER